MKRDVKIWSVILAIAIIGTVITSITKSYVSVQRQQMGSSYFSYQQPEIALSEAADTPKMAAGQPEAFAAQDTNSGAALSEALPNHTDAIERISPSYEETWDDNFASEVSEAEEQSLTAKEKELVSEEVLDEPAAAQLIIEASPQQDGGIDLEDEPSPEAVLDYHATLAEYPNRLAKLDAQIERMRSSETDNTVQSVKSAAQMEQRIWEGELDVVYSLLMESLEEAERENLRASQQQWIKERDGKALEASKKSSGVSMESVEYITSITASTRARVYELVSQYQ